MATPLDREVTGTRPWRKSLRAALPALGLAALVTFSPVAACAADARAGRVAASAELPALPFDHFMGYDEFTGLLQATRAASSRRTPAAMRAFGSHRRGVFAASVVTAMSAGSLEVNADDLPRHDRMADEAVAIEARLVVTEQAAVPHSRAVRIMTRGGAG